MMAPNHPSDVTLLAFAAGTLTEGQRAAVAAHVAGCARCRAYVNAMEHVGGAVLENLPPAPMAEGSLAKVLARLDEPAPPLAAAVPSGAAAPSGLPNTSSPPNNVYRLSDWRRARAYRPPPRTAWAAAAVLILALGVTYLASDYDYFRYVDDYPASTATSGTVPIGGTTVGRIERAGDADWFRVELTSGLTYRFQLEGSDTNQGTLQYPILRLLDGTGQVLHSDAGSVDGPGAGWTSVVRYVAPSTGTYFVSSEARDGDRGTYTISAIVVSGNAN